MAVTADERAFAPASVVGRRLDSLDALRAIAALTVLAQHSLEWRPSFYSRHIAPHYLNLGTFGVTVFFLVSGFIIPRSLERSRNVGVFWINRVTRLYPMLWASLLIAGAAVAVGAYDVPHGFGARGWFANATMVPSRLHQFAIGPLWTLEYELVFYVAMTLLLVLRLHKLTTQLAVLAVGVAVVHALARYPHQTGDTFGAFWYATFFLGGLLGRAWTGEASVRRSLAFFAGLGLTVLIAIALASPHVAGGTYDAQTQVLSRGAAMVLFAVVVLRARRVPAQLAWLGTVSYSIYLLHITVIQSVPVLVNVWVSAVVWGALTIGLAALTFEYVEKPGIALGHRVSGMFAKRART